VEIVAKKIDSYLLKLAGEDGGLAGEMEALARRKTYSIGKEKSRFPSSAPSWAGTWSS
jgi:hypothetical protein